MKNTWLCAALGVASLLTACGTKKSAEETTTTTETTTPATEAPVAEAPAADAPATEAPAATTPAAAFDINTVPVSTADLGGFPYLSKLPGYKLEPHDSVAYEFDRTYVSDGKQIFPVEGRVLRRDYRAIDSKTHASELMIFRNYDNLLKKLGGVQVMPNGKIPQEAVNKIGDEEYRKHAGDIGPDRETTTYVIRQKDKQIWVQLMPTVEGEYYQLNVTETAAMPQQATTLPAAELKKN